MSYRLQSHYLSKNTILQTSFIEKNPEFSHLRNTTDKDKVGKNSLLQPPTKVASSMVLVFEGPRSPVAGRGDGEEELGLG
jgi:hypothetical protein